MRNTIARIGLAALVAVTAFAVPSVGGPSPVAAVSPTPSAPMTMRLEAGHHTGYTFNANGTITGSRSANAVDPLSVQTVQRSSIGTRGVFLRMSTGPMAGYWIRESIVAYVVGIVGERDFTPDRAISLPVGKVLAYTFDASWNLVSAPVLTVNSPSSAMASGSQSSTARSTTRSSAGRSPVPGCRRAATTLRGSSTAGPGRRPMAGPRSGHGSPAPVPRSR